MQPALLRVDPGDQMEFEVVGKQGAMQSDGDSCDGRGQEYQS
jgi:hypothetical protein